MVDINITELLINVNDEKKFIDALDSFLVEHAQNHEYTLLYNLK